MNPFEKQISAKKPEQKVEINEVRQQELKKLAVSLNELYLEKGYPEACREIGDLPLDEVLFVMENLPDILGPRIRGSIAKQFEGKTEKLKHLQDSVYEKSKTDPRFLKAIFCRGLGFDIGYVNYPGDMAHIKMSSGGETLASLKTNYKMDYNPEDLLAFELGNYIDSGSSAFLQLAKPFDLQDAKIFFLKDYFNNRKTHTQKVDTLSKAYTEAKPISEITLGEGFNVIQEGCQISLASKENPQI